MREVRSLQPLRIIFVSEKKVRRLPAVICKWGDTLNLGEAAPSTSQTILTEEEAWLIGAVVAEGWADKNGKAHFTNQDPEYVRRVAELWRQVAGGWTSTYEAESGFTGGDKVTQLRLRGHPGMPGG